MPDRGNAYHVIIYDNEGKVIRAFQGLVGVEVEGDTVRHLKGEIKGIKHNFIVVDDAHVGVKIKEGTPLKPEWLNKDEKDGKTRKEIREEFRFKELEDRLQKIESILAKIASLP